MQLRLLLALFSCAVRRLRWGAFCALCIPFGMRPARLTTSPEAGSPTARRTHQLPGLPNRPGTGDAAAVAPAFQTVRATAANLPS